MQRIMIYLQAVLVSYLLSACSNNKNNPKNNDPAAKPLTSINAASQMSSLKSVADNIINDTSHTILAEALKSADLMETLTKPGPFTVFAPNNNAFKKLPEGNLEGWMNKRKNDLANILSYHIVAGSLKTKDLKDGQKLKTLAGEELIVTLRKNKLMINGTNVIKADIESSNGVIFVIDGMLFPRNQNPAAY